MKAQALSWPEYVSRSVMLVGADYLVTYDRVFNDAVAHRFSWFTKNGDDMPFITMVKGGVERGSGWSRRSRPPRHTASGTTVWATRWLWSRTSRGSRCKPRLTARR